tara:strand:+ start:179 stop:370 length:192 start_codon:yes stop_codon:yes gene_type:complete
MISTNQLKKNLINNPENIDRMLRVLPHFIQQEIDQPQVATPKVLKRLRSQLKMVSELKAIRSA